MTANTTQIPVHLGYVKGYTPESARATTLNMDNRVVHNKLGTFRSLAGLIAFILDPNHDEFYRDCHGWEVRNGAFGNVRNMSLIQKTRVIDAIIQYADNDRRVQELLKTLPVDTKFLYYRSIGNNDGGERTLAPFVLADLVCSAYTEVLYSMKNSVFPDASQVTGWRGNMESLYDGVGNFLKIDPLVTTTFPSEPKADSKQGKRDRKPEQRNDDQRPPKKKKNDRSRNSDLPGMKRRQLAVPLIVRKNASDGHEPAQDSDTPVEPTDDLLRSVPDDGVYVADTDVTTVNESDTTLTAVVDDPGKPVDPATAAKMLSKHFGG